MHNKRPQIISPPTPHTKNKKNKNNLFHIRSRNVHHALTNPDVRTLHLAVNHLGHSSKQLALKCHKLYAKLDILISIH